MGVIRRRLALAVLSCLAVVASSTPAAPAEVSAGQPCTADGTSPVPDWTWTGASAVERHLTMDSGAVRRADPLMSSIRPPIDAAAYADGEPGEVLLRPVGPSGHLGPLGPWGPLGRYGPLGEASEHWDEQLDHLRGSPYLARLLEVWGVLSEPVLDEHGPLGPAGPLGAEAYCETLPSISATSGQLQAGGVYAPLGPAGPLGVYGPLGPLGPRGPMGALLDSADGRYFDGGELVTEVEGAAPGGGGERRDYPLVETYPPGRALAADVSLDTSFMARDVTTPDQPVEYRMASAEEQFVTVTVVPEGGFADLPCLLDAFGVNPCGIYPALGVCPNNAAVDTDDVLVRDAFNVPTPWLAVHEVTDLHTLEVLDGSGQLVAESTSDRYVNWLHVKVPAGARLTARVTPRSTRNADGAARYRIVVTGSTDWITAAGSSGAHQAGAALRRER